MSDTNPISGIEAARKKFRDALAEVRTSSEFQELRNSWLGRKNGRIAEYTALDKIYRSSQKTGLQMKLSTDLDGRSIDPKLTKYSIELKTKTLTRGGMSYIYLDQARAIRE